MLCLNVIFGSFEKLQLKLGRNWGKAELLTADLREDGQNPIITSRGIIVEDSRLGSRQSNEVK